MNLYQHFPYLFEDLLGLSSVQKMSVYRNRATIALKSAQLKSLFMQGYKYNFALFSSVLYSNYE